MIFTITNKAKPFGKRALSIRFEFEHKGKRIVAYQKFLDQKVYENAIIGKQYKVKYLPDNPKNGNAVIFIDQPIE